MKELKLDTKIMKKLSTCSDVKKKFVKFYNYWIISEMIWGKKLNIC